MRSFEANLIGPMFGTTGYDNYWRELLDHLTSYRVTAQSLNAGDNAEVERQYLSYAKMTCPQEITYPHLLCASPAQVLIGGDNWSAGASIHATIWLTMWEVLLNADMLKAFFKDIQWKALITTSEYCANQARPVMDAPIFVVPNHVDTEFFKFGCVDEGRSEHFTFGMTGAWIERKGWKVLAEAWGKADTGDAVLRLRPTFSDAPTQSLKDAVKLFEGLDNVEFAAVDNTKERGGIREFYASIDVNLYPSYGDTIPKAILEPGALGTPSIGSDSSGIAELLVANLQSASQVFAASTEPVEIPAIDSLSGIRQVWEKASWYPPSAEALALRIESAIDQGRTYWEGIGIENMNIIENTYSSAIATKQIRAAWKEIF